MKRAVIFLNGQLSKISDVSSYISSSTTIICANGGTKLAVRFNIIPHIIIGDLDSFSKKLKKELKNHHIKFVAHRTDKDETDSELALDYAIKKGFEEILIFGIFGRRIDHFLGNVLLFSSQREGGVKIKIIEGNQEIFSISSTTVIEGSPGDLLSLLPLRQDCIGITTSGLQYQLTNGILHFGKCKGISNIFVKKTVKIILKSGQLLVIHTKK